MCKCMKRKFDGSEGELEEDTWRGEKRGWVVVWREAYLLWSKVMTEGLRALVVAFI